MVVIVGFYDVQEYGDRGFGYEGWSETHREEVCTFDREEDALQYIEKARLKNPANRFPVFKNDSLLRPFEYVEIEPYGGLPHNPKV